jgi:hypothetical protein
MIKIARKIFMVCLLTASTCASAGVLPVLAVNNPVKWPGVGVGLPGSHYQQNFKAPLTGQLSGFGLFAAMGDTIAAVSVRFKVGGDGGWQTEGWTAQVVSLLNGRLEDLTPFNLHVNAGDNIVFDVGPWSGAGSLWLTGHDLGPIYSKSDNANDPYLFERNSVAFVTWMIPDAVSNEPAPPKDLPVPGAGVLMALGLAMLGLARGLSGRRTR